VFVAVWTVIWVSTFNNALFFHRAVVDVCINVQTSATPPLVLMAIAIIDGYLVSFGQSLVYHKLKVRTSRSRDLQILL
jgi:uncharacterized membrane protein